MLKYTNYTIVFQEIPDEVTLAVNLSNCPNSCEGCHSPSLMEDIGNPLTKEVMHDLMRRYGNSVTCLCFMGGDRDPQEVEQLSLSIRHHFPDIKTGWYSGKSELPRGIVATSFDYIKLGRYDRSRGALRSRTTNQRLYAIEADGTQKDLTHRFWV